MALLLLELPVYRDGTKGAAAALTPELVEEMVRLPIAGETAVELLTGGGPGGGGRKEATDDIGGKKLVGLACADAGGAVDPGRAAPAEGNRG